MVGRDRSAGQPYNDPPIRGLSVVQATLRIFVALECWGFAVSRLVSGKPSSLNRLLRQDFSLPASVASTLDQSVAWCLLICGFVTLVRPLWPLLVAISLWTIAQPIAALVTRFGILPQLEPAQEAVRWMAPIALLFVDFWPPRLKFTYARYQMAMGLLRLGVAVTFLACGLLLIHHSGRTSPLADMLIRGATRLHLGTLSPERAHFALGILGGLEFGIGLTLLLGRSLSGAALATLVGLGAAMLPTIARGTAGYHETLIHLIDGGAPLALFACWSLGYVEHPPTPIAAHVRFGAESREPH